VKLDGGTRMLLMNGNAAGTSTPPAREPVDRR
jgi:hypothetical protein